MADKEPKLESDLLDVSGYELAELDDLPESVLTDAIRRIRAEMSQSSAKSEYYTGFESAI